MIKAIDLTKRELFAAMALQGVLARQSIASYQSAALLAVQYADALIAELGGDKAADVENVNLRG